jgi:hypothetical protein
VDRRRRPKGHGRIDIVHAKAAGLRIGIGHARLHADAVADLEVAHLCSDLDDGSRCLVTQHHRRVDDEGADLAVGVIVHIRTADADCVQLDLDHARPDRIGQVDIAEGELMLLLENERTLEGHLKVLN